MKTILRADDKFYRRMRLRAAVSVGDHFSRTDLVGEPLMYRVVRVEFDLDRGVRIVHLRKIPLEE